MLSVLTEVLAKNLVGNPSLGRAQKFLGQLQLLLGGQTAIGGESLQNPGFHILIGFTTFCLLFFGAFNHFTYLLHFLYRRTDENSLQCIIILPHFFSQGNGFLRKDSRQETIAIFYAYPIVRTQKVGAEDKIPIIQIFSASFFL